MLESEVRRIFVEAKEKTEAAKAAKNALSAVMLTAFRNLMPAGTVIDLRYMPGKQLPGHLASVRTMRGNDRKTRVFRIVNVVMVDADPCYPELSTWMADAVPVSEKTGLDMKGSSGHNKDCAVVRIHGNISSEYSIDEAPGLAIERAIKTIADNAKDS